MAAKVDDGVNPLRIDAEFRHRQFDVAAAEEVQKRIDLPVGCRISQPVREAVTVIDRHDAVRGEPIVVRRTGDAQNGGARALGQLNGDGADPAGSACDGNRVTRVQRDGANRGVRGGARDEESSRRLPGDVVRFVRELIGWHDDEFGLTGSSIAEPDDLARPR